MQTFLLLWYLIIQQQQQQLMKHLYKKKIFMLCFHIVNSYAYTIDRIIGIGNEIGRMLSTMIINCMMNKNYESIKIVKKKFSSLDIHAFFLRLI